MKRAAWRYPSMVGLISLATACVTGTPRELVDARHAYDRANSGPPASYAPTQLYQAKKALDEAYQAFEQHPRSQDVKDLAYVAQRRVEFAEAEARIALARQQRATAEQTMTEEQRRLQSQAQQQVSQSRQQLTEAERQRQQQ